MTVLEVTYGLALKASGGLDGGSVTSKRVKGLEFCRHQRVKVLRRVPRGLEFPVIHPLPLCQFFHLKVCVWFSFLPLALILLLMKWTLFCSNC